MTLNSTSEYAQLAQSGSRIWHCHEAKRALHQRSLLFESAYTAVIPTQHSTIRLILSAERIKGCQVWERRLTFLLSVASELVFQATRKWLQLLLWHNISDPASWAEAPLLETSCHAQSFVLVSFSQLLSCGNFAKAILFTMWLRKANENILLWLWGVDENCLAWLVSIQREFAKTIVTQNLSSWHMRYLAQSRLIQISEPSCGWTSNFISQLDHWLGPWQFDIVKDVHEANLQTDSVVADLSKEQGLLPIMAICAWSELTDC